MKTKITILLALFILVTQLAQSQDFITEWTFPTIADQIRFNAETSGVVNYTWSANPSGNSGSGSFSQGTAGAVVIGGLNIQANDVVTLSMAPINLRRFYIDNGPDRLQLTNVKQWGDTSWSNMERFFFGCENLQITATDVPDLSAVSSMSNMFRNCTNLNSPTNIGSWNTSTITSMNSVFENASSFNQNIGTWNTASVNAMGSMFRNAGSFNQNITNWNTSLVTNMNGMFRDATVFNQDLNSWDTGSVLSMNGMFFGATAFNGNISNWNTASVTNMAFTFRNASSFNQNISNWNIGAVTSTSNMFEDASAFNQNIGSWNTSTVSNMSTMFKNATAFNQDLGSWNTSAVTNMSDMFNNATSFNQNIGDWATGAVEDISRMFASATSFNQNISNWNLAAVTIMNSTFENATVFNQDIGNWDTGSVLFMSGLFRNATSFNQDIGNWNTASVTNMNGIFENASAFNQDIGSWNTSALTAMAGMFRNATSFNQDIGDWQLNLNVNMLSMLDNSGMDCLRYSNTLIGWQLNNPTVINRVLGAQGLDYGTNALASRTALTSSQGWIIIGDAAISIDCSTSVDVPFVTEWTFSSSSTQIRFNAETSGVVNYTWSATPSGNSGSGSFSQATLGAVVLGGLTIQANDVVTLSFEPDNLNRFQINNGPDRESLTNVSQWGTTNWTSMERAFYGCSNLNISATDVPNLSEVSSISQMFRNCSNLNSPLNINNWNTANIVNMSNVFLNAFLFNQNIGSWNTSLVTDMSSMFDYAASFNKDIGNWNTSAVTNMRNMFLVAIDFNRNIGSWDVSSVTDMAGMFMGAQSFNQDIGGWNVGMVNIMGQMFQGALNFNQNISNWHTANVNNMFAMFEFASSFNQNLGSWELNSDLEMSFMLDSAGMDCDNYSATLVGWQANNPTVINRTFGASGLAYGLSAVAARDALVNNQGWTITGDTSSGDDCDAALSVDAIDMLNAFEVKVYPNPSTDAFTLKFKSVHPKVEILVFNISGQLILNQSFENSDLITIDLKHGSGVYFININSGQQSLTQKLIKI